MNNTCLELACSSGYIRPSANKVVEKMLPTKQLFQKKQQETNLSILYTVLVVIMYSVIMYLQGLFSR